MIRTHIRKHFLSTVLTALLFIGAGVFLVAGPASAQLQLLGQAVGPDCNWAGGETFGLGAFTQLAINALKLIWGILGSLALVMFVWGGFLWLTARGEEQQIKQGWDTLINAVIGLVIVLGSWVIINTIVLSLTNPGSWDVGKLFGGTAWTKIAESNAVCVKIAKRTPGFVSSADRGTYTDIERGLGAGHPPSIATAPAAPEASGSVGPVGKCCMTIDFKKDDSVPGSTVYQSHEFTQIERTKDGCGALRPQDMSESTMHDGRIRDRKWCAAESSCPDVDGSPLTGWDFRKNTYDRVECK